MTAKYWDEFADKLCLYLGKEDGIPQDKVTELWELARTNASIFYKMETEHRLHQAKLEKQKHELLAQMKKMKEAEADNDSGNG